MSCKFWFGSVFTAFAAVLILIGACLMIGCKSKEKESVVSEGKGEEEKVDEELKVVESKAKMVKLETSLGDIVIALDEQAAPVTVKNFLVYVEEGFLTGRYSTGL